jgi:hypothetical protein
VVRIYNNLQDRGDCQTTGKPYKTEVLVGWVVGWKKSTNSETTPHSFPRISFWIVSELAIQELARPLNTSVYQELPYSFEAANLAVRFGSTWVTDAVKHRSHPARAPKTKLKPNVSQK